MVTDGRATRRLAALQCMSWATLGHEKAHWFDSQFDKVGRENEDADVTAARIMANDGHQREYGCVSSLCGKYGNGG